MHRILCFIQHLAQAGRSLAFVSPYDPNDMLALSFGGSPACPKSRPTRCDVLPTRPGFQQARSGKSRRDAERAAAAWKGLEHADLLPKIMSAPSKNRYLRVAATVK